MSGGFAAILARLSAPQLRLHCDGALKVELMQVQHAVEEARAAMQRLREVARAAQALGSSDAAGATADATLAEMEHAQRTLGRAVAAFGAPGAGSYVASSKPSKASSVCCTCGRVEGKEQEKLVEDAKEEPLLAEPDTAALSPPKRRKPVPKPTQRETSMVEPRRCKPKSPKRAIKRPPVKRQKLVVPRRNSPVQEEEGEAAVDEEETVAASPEPEPTLPTTPKKEKPRPRRDTSKASATDQEDKDQEDKDQEEEDGDVVVVDDESGSEDDDGEDVRVRLQRHIDACWPLATRLGALEMPQRRRADYADLVPRVRALFRTLLACEVDDVASRSMRSVLVKARDSLAVAVSLLSLHEVTDANAPIILALVKAVDTASEKHATLQKQVAPFRNSLADIEVALLTRNYTKPATPKQETKPPRKKPRAGR